MFQLQNDLVQQFKSRAIITDAHVVTRDLMQLLTKVFFERKARDKPKHLIDQEVTRRTGQQIGITFKRMLLAAKEDEKQKRNVRHLKRTALQMSLMFDEICAHQNQGVEHWKTVRKKYDHDTYILLLEFLDGVTDLISVEAAKDGLKPTLSQEFQIKFNLLIFGGIGFSILVAIALGIIFAVAIQKPIAHIAENSRRMSQRKKLLPALKGKDELGELDRLLHSAATGIEKALLKEQSMVDNAIDMICTFDYDGRFKRVNLAAQRLTGWPIEALITRSVFDFILADDVMTAEEKFRQVKSKSTTCTFDLRMLRKTGEIVDTRWSCIYSPRDDDLFAVVHDITEEKNVERLKQDFLDMITHDLRSPLTSMLGNMSMIEEGATGAISADAKKEVGTAVSNIEHLIEFVNDLLDFQKLKAGRMQMRMSQCSLDELIDESVSLIDDFAQSRQVSIKAQKTSLAIECDRSKFIQVIVNLISNAVKFSPANSTVEVCAEDSGKDIKVTVSDSGTGVPPHLKTKIFEAFEQVHVKSGEGTGLGLAICKLIVEAHGGAIAVNNRPQGSDFWFTIPKKKI